MQSSMPKVGAMLVFSLLSACASPYAQSGRDIASGRGAAERARSDFSAARRDEAYGNYGQASYDRAAGRIARSRAESDFLAGNRDRVAGY